MERLTGNWRNLPAIEGALLHQDQKNWVAITHHWWNHDARHFDWILDLQGLGKTHAFLCGIEARTIGKSIPTELSTSSELWQFYFDQCSLSNKICKMMDDSLLDLGGIFATYWVRALWDFLAKASNRSLPRPSSLVNAVPRLLDLKELVRLLRAPLAKGEVAQLSPDAHKIVRPIDLGMTDSFAWQVLDNRGEGHTIDRVYLAEQFLRCFGLPNT